jgi:hypothetical protein
MKVICLIALLFLLTGVGIVAADTSGATPDLTPTVLIEGYQLTPSILMPGDTAILTVTIGTTYQNVTIEQNSGTSSGGDSNEENTPVDLFIENVHLEGNGIIVKTPDFSRLGSLGPGQSIPVTFLIQAPDKDGVYFPEVWIDVQDGSSTRYPIPVNVNTHISVEKKPELLLNATLPDQIVPGDDFSMYLDISNKGESRADDITITINSSISSVSLDGPENFYLDHLDPGTDAGFNLTFSTDKNSPLGMCDVPVIVTFREPDGTQVTQIEHIGIHMEGKAEVSIKSLTTDPIWITPGQFTMVFRIENTGTDDAKSVEASIDLPMDGNKEAFVGKIEPGNDAPAVFYLTDTGNGEIPYTLMVQYTDDYGNHTLEKNLKLDVSSPDYGDLVLAIVVIGVALLCGAGIWYWRKIWRKKRQ